MNTTPYLTIREASRINDKGSIRKLENYYEEYEFHFSRVRERSEKSNTQIKILEIGVQGGGSLHMWKEYFPYVHITGVDTDSTCRKYADGKYVDVEIGDQANKYFLQKIEKEHGPFDIIIDDGGHTMTQQLTSFKTLFPLLKDDGIYVIEDIHTSYWYEFGGKIRKRKTAVGLLKELIDDMHYWAVRHSRATLLQRVRRKIYAIVGWQLPLVLPRNVYEEYIKSIHIADSIAFIYKGKVEKHKIRQT